MLNFARPLFSFLALLFVSTASLAASRYNMPIGVTPVSHDVYHLHMLIMYICCAIGVVVFGVLFYALVKHRKSKGAKPAHFHESLWVEILWTLIPFLILIAMAIPATRVMIRVEDSSRPDLTIKITGYQWRWQYEYLDQGISFFSNLATPLKQIHNEEAKSPHYLLEVDHPLVLPVGQKVRFLITSNDVIHSWWVPALAVKTDAVPGFIHDAWARIEKPGIYRGQCAELCGANHAYMPIVVKAVPLKEFQAWLLHQHHAVKERKKRADETIRFADLMKNGTKLYEQYCSACHKQDGRGMPPVFPALKGSAIATGAVAGHIAMVQKGVPGTAMQAFEHQLTDFEMAAIITYERNAWGNGDRDVWGPQAGGTVQPSDIPHTKENG